jgi:hypothetical protein
MLSATVKITGISPLLQNNSQTVDRFNPYTKKMATINAKKTRRTDDDYRELHDIEIRSKIYFDESLGIYVPATWVTASIEATAFKVAKISKADIRGALFAAEDKIKLAYRDSSKVKEPLDIVKNGDFRINLTLKQGQPRIVKAFPIFHEWSFETTLEFDDKIIDPDSLTRIIQHVARYGGFGDFRPKFGRANADVKHG